MLRVISLKRLMSFDERIEFSSIICFISAIIYGEFSVKFMKSIFFLCLVIKILKDLLKKIMKFKTK